jgi:hypothetical protein
MQNCYLLTLDFNHSGDPEYDAFNLPFEGDNMIGAHMMGVREVELPRRIYFTADFELIPKYDFPLTNLNMPVMSLRMWRVLEKLTPLNYRHIPITMIDDSYLDHPFDNQGNFKPGVSINEDYVGVKFNEYTSAFDFENSDYDEDDIFPGEIAQIRSLVLKEPAAGFPSIFRMKECRSKLFVSQVAKEALEASGIVGCVFEQVATAGTTESENIPTKIIVVDLDETNKTILALLSAHPNGLSYGYFDRLISEHIPTIQSSVPSLSSRISTMQAQGLIQDNALKITERGLLLL